MPSSKRFLKAMISASQNFDPDMPWAKSSAKRRGKGKTWDAAVSKASARTFATVHSTSGILNTPAA